MAYSSQEHTKITYSVTEIVVNWLYSILIGCLAPFLAAHWLINTLLGKAGYGRHRLGRLGFIASDIKPSNILIHCVSVGEVSVAASLVKKIHSIDPQISFTLTTTTPTGAANVKRLLADSVQHLYLPIDLGILMRRLLKRINPQQVFIIEVELWPNMINQCARKHIPVSVINARMTDKSATSYQKLAPLFQPMLRALNIVCAQGQRDFDNYLKLGLAESRCLMSGNIKFDVQEVSASTEQVNSAISGLNGLVLIGGSTHEPEESILLEAYQILYKQFPSLILIVVPRHPQRFDSVFELINKSGLNVVRLSDSATISENTQIVVVDVMGLLKDLYALSNIAFVGGSIADRGGHNALEPAALGVPILMGPHVYNNPDICKTLRQHGCLIEVSTAQEIARQCQLWITNSQDYEKASQAGLVVVQENKGALDLTLKTLGFQVN